MQFYDVCVAIVRVIDPAEVQHFPDRQAKHLDPFQRTYWVLCLHPSGSTPHDPVHFSINHTIKIPPPPPPLSPFCWMCVLILDNLSIILMQGEAPVILWPIVPAIVLYLLYGTLVPTPHGMLLLKWPCQWGCLLAAKVLTVSVSLHLPSLSVRCSSPSISASLSAV